MADKKPIFKAVVIDDEPSRNATYTKVLSTGNRYDVSIINDISQIRTQEIMKYDLLVIDVCLSKAVEDLTAFKILREYDLTLPTVLVSSEWIDRKTGQPNQFILCVPEFKNIIKVIGWNDFNEGDSNERIANEIFYEHCKYENYYSGTPSDIINILHISDLQFGGKTSGLACNDNDRISDYLNNNNIRPDLLVITGDIADKGKKSEFDEAKRWIERLISRLWDNKGRVTNEMRSRIILVPGNHDYDLSINASELYEFVFKQKTIDSFKKKETVATYTNQKLGFYNYIEFARELTGNNEWNEYLRKPLHVNTKFATMGIQFFTLNSVFNISNRNCENKFDSFYCDLSNLGDEQFRCNERRENSMCNILVTHNPLSCFKNELEAGLKTWNRMQTLIQDNKLHLCFYGHSHDTAQAYRLHDNGGNYCKKMVCISAPSVRLNAASRTEDAGRGFNVIELHKKDGVVSRILPRFYALEKAEIVPPDPPSEEDYFRISL